MMCNFRYIIGLFFLLSSHFVFSQAKIKTITLQETPLREIHIQYMYNYGLNMIMYQKPEYSQHSGFWQIVENLEEFEGVSFIPRSDSKVYISGSLIEWSSTHLIHNSVPSEEAALEIAPVEHILRTSPWNTQIPVKFLSDSLETNLFDKYTHVETIYEEVTTMHSWVSFSGLYQKGAYYYIEVSWRYPYQECMDCPVLAMYPRRSYFVFRYCPLQKLVIPVFMTPSIFNHEVCGLRGGLQDWFIELSKDYFCKEE